MLPLKERSRLQITCAIVSCASSVHKKRENTLLHAGKIDAHFAESCFLECGHPSFFHCSVKEEMEATQAREGKRWVLEKEKSKCYFDKSVEPALRVDEGDIIRLETSDEAYYRLSQGESAGVSFALR